MKKAAFLIAVFCAGVLSICYFSGNAGAGDADGLKVNKLKGARQWKALQEYMLRQKTFSAMPSFSWDFLSPSKCLFRSGELPEGRAASWRIDAGKGFIEIPGNYFQEKWVMEKYRSFRIVCRKEGGCFIALSKAKRFKAPKCYELENPECGADHLFILFK